MAESSEIVEAGDQAEAPAKKSKKKLIMIGAAGAVLLLGGGGAGAFFLSGGDSAAAEESAHAAPAPAGEAGAEADAASFVDVPPMVVNLRSPDGAPRFLKLHFMLVPGPAGSSDAITAKLPLILDAYQPFLRELRPEDLAGSAAVFRIKEEMLLRATDVVGRDVVSDILIQDMVQQ
ncbi:flagellar basal body-associated FliL family protein [Sphingosinithalassobacter sp. CS137]|uniref:flagellar basal body-associated FliL family protein n=1 Tax=Sphingosinithalassobacter sp. CS137 TaxID=2762748 RepID=UPI00165D9272|nr:flagellar basal body-associated FliL family protein [Sphingosinithalassobacter sp. CS137]